MAGRQYVEYSDDVVDVCQELVRQMMERMDVWNYHS